LEYKFASAVDAPSTGTVRLSGGAALAYTGLGYPPDDFVVSGGGAGFFLADSGFASVYTSLPLSQQLSGAPGRVNEVVVGLAPEADPTVIAAELTAALAAAEPPISATVTLGADEISYRVLYEDIEQDEEFWTIIAMLMLVGATFAALNLISRVVEGERREIGIGMALGKRTWTLAVRPLLLGLEIAVVGVVLGLLIGWLLTIPLEGLFTSLLPLPVWETPLVLAPFARAAAFGVLLPMVAVAWPVWRAVRVEPVDAIRVGHLAARGAGWSGLLRRVPVPGRSYWEMPLRNLLRTPRRTVLTALGVAMAITVTITVSGLIDSFTATIDEAEAEVTTTAPDRLSVRLDTFRPLDDPVLAQVSALPGVAEVIPGLAVGARGAGGDVDLLVEVLDPVSAPWRPTVIDGEAGDGLLLTAPALRDLGAAVGDEVTLTHPVVTPTGVALTDSRFRVAGVHPYPLRPVAYLDPVSAEVFGLTGATNQLTVLPDGDADPDAVRRALFEVPAVAGVTSPASLADAFREAVDEFVGILAVVALVTVALVLLIAFNAASISADERRREHATMFAYGLRSRTVLGMSMTESALLGVLGTAFGVALGSVVLRWMVLSQLPDTLPEIGLTVDLSRGSLVQAAALGVIALAVAPLFTARRLRHMDVPGTLRVVE
jgi:putative ABC transport system permease protein